MRKKTDRTDQKILATATLLVLMMLYLLYDDSLILPSDDSANLTSIGKISTTEHDVRRKVSKQFIWRSARLKDTVHIGDSVFTGPGSSVEVELKDGRKVTLQENSLVVFSSSGDQLKLDLQFGRVAGPADGCLQIDVKGQSQDVCGKNTIVEADADVPVKKITPPKESLVWVTPPPSDFYHSKNQTPLKVTWTAERSLSRFRFQLSRENDFKKISYEIRTQAKEISTLGYPPHGDFFVRIQGDDIKGRPVAYTKVQKIHIEEAPLPEILTPLAQTKVSIPTDVDGELLQSNQVSVSWKYPLPGSKFEMEVARDRNFTEIVNRETGVPDLKAQTGKLASGDYYVRVRDAAVTNGTRRPWSAPVNFKMEIQKAPALATPELVTEKVDYLAPTPEELKLKWAPVERAQKYHVEMAPDPDFSNPQTFTTNSTEFTVKEPTPGKAYFRVTAETAKGTRSETSDSGSLEVRLKTPVIEPVENRVVQGKTPEDPGDPQTLKVGWTDLKLADSYTVEVAEDPDFKTKKDYQSSTPTTEIVLPHPGDYYWRVKATSKTGKALTKYSEPGQMKYVLKVPLATPDLIEPFEQATLFFQKNISPYVWFEWKPVRQANEYTLEIATDPQFSQKVLSIKTKSRRYLLKEQLPQATLYWRVQAHGDDQRVSFWTNPRQMNVYIGRAPASHGSSSQKRPKEDHGP